MIENTNEIEFEFLEKWREDLELKTSISELVNGRKEFLKNIKNHFQKIKKENSQKVGIIIHKNNLKEFETLVKIVESSLQDLGMISKRECLESNLKAQISENWDVIIVFISEDLGEVKEIKEELKKFSKRNMDSMIVLNCRKEFEVAIKVVDRNQLIRNVSKILEFKKESNFEGLLMFWDVFWALRGSQGLGVFPDLLDTERVGNETLRGIYENEWNKMFDILKEIQGVRTLRSKAFSEGDEENTKNNNEMIFDESWNDIEEQINKMFNIQQTQETNSVNERVIKGLKYLLIFCEKGINQKLVGKKITESIIKKTKETQEIVIWVPCSTEVEDNNNLILNHFKKSLGIQSEEILKNTFKKSMTLILSNYEKLKTYENIIKENGLNRWNEMKLIVICEKKFFFKRRWQSCFLDRSDTNEKKRAKVIFFNPKQIQSNEREEEEEEGDDEKENEQIQKKNEKKEKNEEYQNQVRKIGLLKELESNMKKIGKSLLSTHSEITNLNNIQWFISYAWQDWNDNQLSLDLQQEILSQMVKVFSQVGLFVWLDINQMTGNIDEQMAQNIARSRGVLVVGTPKYLDRAQKETNVKKEVEAMKEKFGNKLSLIFMEFLGQKINERSEQKELFETLVIQKNENNNTEQVYYEEFQEVVSKIKEKDWKSFGEAIFDLLVTMIKSLNPNDENSEKVYQMIDQEKKKFKEEIDERILLNHVLIEGVKNEFKLNDFETRLKGYIEAYGLKSRFAPLTTRFLLWPLIEEFLNKKKRCLVVLGESGSGKSLFAGWLIKQLLQNKKNDESQELENIPIYIRLQEFATRTDEELKNNIEIILKEKMRLSKEEFESLKKDGKGGRLVVVMDGYDEIGGEGGKRFINLCEQLKEFQREIKVIIIGRAEYFDLDNSPEHIFKERERSDSKVEVVYISPFNEKDIKKYCEHFDSSMNSSNSLSKLEKITGLQEMLKNPFTLSAVLQSIEQLEENRKKYNRTGSVVRFEIYEAFIKQWIDQELEGTEGITFDECYKLCENLSNQLFKEKKLIINENMINSVYDCSNNNLDESGNMMMMIAEMIPIRWTGREATFVHKSVYEYFISLIYVKEIDELIEKLNKNNDNNDSVWEQRILSQDERSVMLFIGDFIRLDRDKTLNSCWWEWSNTRNLDDNHLEENEKNNLQFKLIKLLMKKSSILNEQLNDDEPTSPFGGNIVSVLNYSGFNFSGMDLSRLNISGADLQNSNLHHATLSESTLCSKVLGRITKSNLKGSFVQGLNLDRAKMGIKNENNEFIDCEFGLFPDLLGHTDGVRCLSFSKDGSKIVSGSVDETIRIWNTLTGICENTFEGHTEVITGVAFSNDEKKIYSSSFDKSFRVWDVSSGKCEKKILIFFIQCMDVSPDRTKVVVGSDRPNIQVRDISSGDCEKSLQGHTSSIASVVFSPDGSKIASGSADETVKIWDLASGECEKTLEHSDYINCVVFSPDGKKIACSSNNEPIQIWDVYSGKSEISLEGHSEPVLTLNFSSDGTKIYSGSEDKTVRVWDVSSGKCESIFMGHTNYVNCVVPSPDGHKIASGSEDSTIQIRNILSTSCENILQGHSDSVTCVSLSPDGTKIVSGSKDNTARVWDLRSGKCVNTFENPKEVDSIVLSQDGTKFGCVTTLKMLSIWNLKTGKCENTINEDVLSFNFFPTNSNKIVIGLVKQSLQIWDLISETCEKSFETDPNFTNHCIQISSDEKTVITGSQARDTSIRIWDIPTGKCMNVLKGHKDFVTSIVLSKDEKMIISGSNDKTIRIWELSSGKCLKTLQGHTKWVRCVSLSPDGSKIISGSSDNTIRVWDVSTGKCEFTFKGFTNYISSVAFSTDGTKFVSGSFDTTVRVWDIKPNNWDKSRLLWSSHEAFPLSCIGCSAMDVIGISPSNNILLNQKGAKSKPK